MSNRIEGTLDAVVDGRAIGWAWDREQPDAALEVEVLVDGEAAVTGIAEIERDMLIEAGIGSGRYGFDIALPEELAGEGSREIKVLVGPERTPISPFSGFETISRFPEGPWALTKFVAEDHRTRQKPFVPEPEVPCDPGAEALVGKDGWLFVGGDANLSAVELTGAALLSGADLESRVEPLVERHRKMRELRTPYLLAVVPLKERIYPQYLPEGASLHRRLPSRQLAVALRQRSGGDLLDLLPALLDGRREGLMFPRTDSCWSDRGAFFAYRELVREAEKRVVDLGEPLTLEQASFVSRPGFRGDLAEKPKCGLVATGFVASEEEGEWEEEIERANVSALRSQRMPVPEHLDVTPGKVPHLYEIQGEPSLPRAVLVGDASCAALIPWLAEHFRRFVFLWSGADLPYEALELEAPDVVIHVISERLLVRGLKADESERAGQAADIADP